ncbi:hypothetical protein [Fodinicola feengrottensis]|uniref:hypothetical protein n=1 Tax=Fodinicola feengrottensis TaxID=435914 RepID=UPI002441617B|nr:hypothetical protein [Fodinicola feengrottensis]
MVTSATSSTQAAPKKPNNQVRSPYAHFHVRRHPGDGDQRQPEGQSESCRFAEGQRAIPAVTADDQHQEMHDAGRDQQSAHRVSEPLGGAEASGQRGDAFGTSHHTSIAAGGAAVVPPAWYPDVRTWT